MKRPATFVGIAAVAGIIGGCAYTPPPSTVVPGSNVGGVGSVGYSHEALGANKHLITITAAPGLAETESSIAQRIHIFASKFAAQTCPAVFEFVHDPNFNQAMSGGFMKRTKTYVFICKT